jgi:hypothetical protein
MIRRCLELLCLEKKSSGPNLKQRVANLGSHVILSPALLKGADELRLLGNDARTLRLRIMTTSMRSILNLLSKSLSGFWKRSTSTTIWFCVSISSRSRDSEIY